MAFSWSQEDEDPREDVGHSNVATDGEGLRDVRICSGLQAGIEHFKVGCIADAYGGDVAEECGPAASPVLKGQVPV